MAEILGLAASIFAVVQVTDRVISLCKHYIECVQDAPSDLRTILVETSTLKAILENIEFLIECDNGQSAIFDSLSGTSGPIQGCHEAMKSLEALFSTGNAPSQGPTSSMKDRARTAFANLTWPLKESKARKLMEDVARYKGTLVLALTADSAHLMRDLVQRTNRLQLTLSESERHEVFKWLEDIDPSSLHHRAQANYEPGTCDWATRLSEWPEFLSGKERCLWIHGIPGAGKTILASQLIDKIAEHCEAADSGRFISVWYYCYFGHNQDESISLLKWILSRLCREANEVSDHLWKLFKHGGTPSLKDLLTAIERELECFDEVYVTIDAIDESNPREDLLKVIRRLATEKRFNKIRLLLTSREYADIEIVMIEFSMSISMKNEFLDADIRLYTESRLQTEKHIKSWPAELRQETVEALSHGAQGMFRWVVCQIDVLRRIRRREAIREALSRLPKTLDEAYDRIFEQIEDEDLPYVNSAMKWLCFEAKLHTGVEACVDMQMLAQAVDEDIFGDNLEEELSQDTESLREICGCLVTVTPTTLENGQQRFYVSFAHYTVLEYLASNKRNHPDPFFTLEKEGLVFDKADRIFARAICLSDDEFEEYKAVTWTEAGHDIFTLPNFGSYCAYTSIDIIIFFDGVFSEHNDLLYRVLDVLDTEKDYFFPLFSIWSNRARTLMDHNTVKIDNYDFVENVEWETVPDLETRVLVRLLVFGCLRLAKALLERMEPSKPFRLDLDFRYNVLYDRDAGLSLERIWRFQGTLTDCFAALFPATSMGTFRTDGIDVFKLLIEVGAEDFDPQGALIPFGALHEHTRHCSDWCVLEKLLSLGADPNADGCYVTPLQIAVATFDIEGVLALLQAGANPNAEGCVAASAWPEDTLLCQFNSLNGWRPLDISVQIRDPEMFQGLRSWSIAEQDYKRVGETIQSSIEAILLEYGAGN